jgi:PadR family transcriptional regulator PadR
MARRQLESDGGPPLKTTDLLVLAVLREGPQHGYAIAQEIAARTRGQVTVRPGDLYRVLYRMDRAGLIEAAPPPARRRDASERDERRADYRITPLGRRVARAQATLLSEICAAVLARRSVLPGAAS